MNEPNDTLPSEWVVTMSARPKEVCVDCGKRLPVFCYVVRWWGRRRGPHCKRCWFSDARTLEDRRRVLEEFESRVDL